MNPSINITLVKKLIPKNKPFNEINPNVEEAIIEYCGFV